MAKLTALLMPYHLLLALSPDDSLTASLESYFALLYCLLIAPDFYSRKASFYHLSDTTSRVLLNALIPYEPLLYTSVVSTPSSRHRVKPYVDS
jgi:hypothetical protein